MTAYDDVVPGTLHLVNVDGDGHVSGQEHTTKGDIQLYPRPTNDPEDPLNWTRARKMRAVWLCYAWAFAIGLAYAFPFSVLADITRDTGITTEDLVQASGLLQLLCGWGCLPWQPIAVAYGRRGIYLIVIALLIPITFWTAYLHSTWEFYAVRILFGFVMAPIETIPELTIPDTLFAHERGAYIAMYVVSIFGSSYVGPLIAGWFSMAFGWRNAIMFSGVILIAVFLLVFFFMEETMYFRPAMEGLEDQQDPAGSSADSSPVIKSGEHTPGEKGAPSTTMAPLQLPPADFAPRKTYLQKLKLFTLMDGRPTVPQTLAMLYRPLLMLVQFPTVAWCGFMYGIMISWFSVINSTASPILSLPPYNFTSGLVGTVYIGPAIGTAFACWWSGVLADKLALRLARRNGGIREPEQRLWPLALSAILSCVGLIIWGVGAQYGLHWMVLVVGLALLSFAVVTGSSISLAYNIDCFKDISSESTTAVIIVRNTMGFALSYAIGPWYAGMGLQNCFIMAGFLSMASILTFLLFTWKGKALRKWSAPRYYRYAATSIKH